MLAYKPKVLGEPWDSHKSIMTLGKATDAPPKRLRREPEEEVVAKRGRHARSRSLPMLPFRSDQPYWERVAKLANFATRSPKKKHDFTSSLLDGVDRFDTGVRTLNKR